MTHGPEVECCLIEPDEVRELAERLLALPRGSILESIPDEHAPDLMFATLVLLEGEGLMLVVTKTLDDAKALHGGTVH